MMITNRYGHLMQLDTIKEVEKGKDNVLLTLESGSTFGVKPHEDFVPQPGDYVVLGTTRGSLVTTVIVEGRVLLRKTDKDLEQEHQRLKDNLRLDRLERYLKNKDAMQERVKNLPKPLRERIERFGEEGGLDFWIEDAGYEMASIEGAAALLRKVQSSGWIKDIDDPTNNAPEANEAAIKWINEWWALNSKERNYDYARQMELVPDFGTGHSGNTAGGAYSLAIAILEGHDV